MVERFVKQIFNLIYSPIRDFAADRRFHRLGGDPVYSGMYATYDAASKSMPTQGAPAIGTTRRSGS